MKALFIGGTGTISTAVSKLAVKKGWDLYLLNRGTKAAPEGANVIKSDINDAGSVLEKIRGINFDVVADFIAYEPSHVERDINLFSGRTGQYIFISSASAYQKPLSYYRITESTPLVNPYWEYSRKKIECEQVLIREYRENGFPATIVRPSHTYSETSIPIAVRGKNGCWQVIDRMLKGKPVLIPGDGTSLWTLTHSTDFARAFYGIMGNSAAIGECIHITSDESLTWNGIYDTIGNALNVEVKKFHVSSYFLATCDPDYEGSLIGDKSNSVVFDNSKIKRLVPDYVPVVRFDRGVKWSIEYLMSHPELQVPDKGFDDFCDRVVEAQQKAVAFVLNR
jgi:nucleoside-diphosphate-sugar epimerase